MLDPSSPAVAAERPRRRGIPLLFEPMADFGEFAGSVGHRMLRFVAAALFCSTIAAGAAACSSDSKEASPEPDPTRSEPTSSSTTPSTTPQPEVGYLAAPAPSRLPLVGDAAPVVTRQQLENPERLLAFSAPDGWGAAGDPQHTNQSTIGDNMLMGFAAADYMEPGRLVIATASIRCADSEPVSSRSKVTAADGAEWFLLPDSDDGLTVATTERADGCIALAFRGLNEDEWTAGLMDVPSADARPFALVTPDVGNPIGSWLPVDLRDRWQSTVGELAQVFVLAGPDGRSYRLTVGVGAAPETIERVATSVRDPESKEPAMRCELQDGTPVCGWMSDGGPLLSVWRDGTRLDVSEFTGYMGTPADTDPNMDLDAALERIGVVVRGLSVYS